MAKNQVIAINDAVHKLQLAMLDGITHQNQLLAAGTVMSRFDYEDVVTERTIAKLCGYPLCRRSLPSDVSSRGKYRISLKEHRVYDLQETRKFCSADCLINSRAFSGTLQDARTSDFDSVKLNELLGLFGDSNTKDGLDSDKDLGLSKLTIRENFVVSVAEPSPEQWMGSSNAVEGYVPLRRSNFKSRNGKQKSKATQNNKEKHGDSPFSELEFTSTVIFPDGYSVSKLPPQTKEASPVGELDDGKGKTALRDRTAVPPAETNSRLRREKEKDSKNKENGKGKKVASDFSQTAVLPRKNPSVFKDREMEKFIKNFGFDEMGLESSDFMSDGYSVSKQPPCSVEDPLSCHSKVIEILDGKNAPQESSSGSSSTGSRKKPDKLVKKSTSVECHANSCEEDRLDVCSIAKSCLKVSDSKKINRSVTWADQNGGCGNLCEVENDDVKASINPSSTYTEDVNSASRLALAEACATALSQAAEAVSSGNSDASDAAAKSGIVLLPSTHELNEEVLEEHIQEEMAEEEPTLMKWPNKPGMPDSDVFDRDQFWFDGPPEGFSLNLSSFAIMWNALFEWVSSSSLAFIYGKDESAHEEFLLVNGKEYLRRTILGDGLSSAIKETIAGCLARALPRVATNLKLPVAISELEKGLGSLLETMSLTGAVPSFRLEEWLVIVVLFLDALSMCRIPRISPYISNRNKVLEGSGIGSEEYETMKEILLPLGRVPQFATRSGA